MYTVVIPKQEGYDKFNPKNNTFLTVKGIDEEITLEFEHSLISLQEWEAKYHKPFIHTKDKTEEETKYYIQCMCLNKHVNPDIFSFMTSEDLKGLGEYIADPQTATTINQNNKKGKKEIITAEIIYYWMIELGIPAEYRFWNLNRLLMLIQVCSIKSQPSKKMSPLDAALSNKKLNAARKKKLGTHG